MSDAIIKVEGLGKKYRIRHQRQGRSYVALRDVIAYRVKELFRSRQSHDGKQNSVEDFWALKDVSFEVKRGDVVGVIGRNGAGKSTLLKVLSRITEPTEGRVRLRGRVASLLEVGTGFHPELTGRENIFLNGAILGMSRAEIKGKFDEIVAFAEVEKFLDTPVKRYSSGMYVRLAFAVAAHLEPEILIVDEVLAVGDAEFQKKCLGKMQDVATKEDRTVLFVSHNMAAVQSLCRTAILLREGRLQESDDAETVVRSYVSDLGKADGGGPGHTQMLGRNLCLRKLSFAPNGVVSGEAAEFRVEFSASEPVRLREACILIYSDYGTRVAVLDLRQAGLHDAAVDSGGLAINGTIRSVPLVEGDYRIGLYVLTDDHAENHLDIASLSVASSTKRENFVPYSAAQRGHVELDFTATLQQPSVESATS